MDAYQPSEPPALTPLCGGHARWAARLGNPLVFVVLLTLLLAASAIAAPGGLARQPTSTASRMTSSKRRRSASRLRSCRRSPT